MKSKWALWTAVTAGVFGLITTAGAAPQAPVAVVEDVRGNVAGIEFMDYVSSGQVIKLGPKDQIVLGYMKSCWRETITGGTVVVGTEQSLVYQSVVDRSKVDCDPSGMQLGEHQADQSAATVFRSMSPAQQAALKPQVTVYGVSPMLEVKGPGTLLIQRTDQQGDRRELTVSARSLAHGRFYDLAKTGTALTPGANYLAILGSAKAVFRVDPRAKPGATPVVGRLLRLE